MQATRLTNYIAFAAVLAANLLAGRLVSSLCGIYRDVYRHALEGAPLPRLTEAVLHYASVANPTLVGAIAGLVCCALLAIGERSEPVRSYLAFLTSCGWVVALLHCSTAAFALALPFLTIIDLHK